MKKTMAVVGAIALSCMIVGCEKAEVTIANMNKDVAAKHLSIEGKNLFIGIVSANTDREAAGLPDVWPHTSEEDGLTDEADDISGKKYSSATEYFKTLFDVEGRNPYVDVGNVGKDSALVNGRSKWCVAQGITCDMPDSVPVLISANFDCSILPSAWSGTAANANTTIPISTLDNIGDSAIVVIYKGGTSKIIDKEDVSLSNILGTGPIVMLPPSWLTPDGVSNSRK